MKRVLRHFPFGLAVIVAVFSVADTPMTAAVSRASQHRATRLDTQLRGVLDETAPAPQRVIIRVRPGSRLALRDSLTAHGDRILSEHESIDALTAIVHGEDLATLVDSDAVLSVSSDAIVRPHGLLGGLLGGVLGGVVNLVVNVVKALFWVVPPIVL